MHRKMMSDLAEKVRKDSLSSGFPSELRAEAIFKSHGWSVTGNLYFIDQDENKGREIDLRAYTNFNNTEIEPVVFCWSLLSAEVKKSVKPWVIFTSPRGMFENNTHRKLAHMHNTSGHLETKLQKLHPSMSMPRIGRTSQVAFSHDTSTIFSSVVGATKAAIDDHKAAEEHGEIWSDDSIDAVIYEPIVILDGPLFECYIEAGELITEQASVIQYGLHYASPNYKHEQYFVDIVTLDYLEIYLKKKEEWLSILHDYLLIKNSGKKA